jgi:ADP-ribosyl-[dinitrogen reductase] hydrolase
VAEIRGSGYVVDALEASLWCLLNTKSFKQAVLRGVNLGDDTDTTGAITGALAGIRYGLDAIPADWRARLARCDDLEKLFKTFVIRVRGAA